MRKRHRLTQETIAERMGVSQPTVAAFERYDANPTLATVRRYALAVGASIDHVVKDECCDNDVTAFEALAKGTALGWSVVPPARWAWGWSPGAINIPAHA
ncbi:hypothetical protein DSM26151_05380 [Agromyces marinus]|nr:hypothetical protein DSM26151_05380 [Agromyces marinus]